MREKRGKFKGRLDRSQPGVELAAAWMRRENGCRVRVKPVQYHRTDDGDMEWFIEDGVRRRVEVKWIQAKGARWTCEADCGLKEDLMVFNGWVAFLRDMSLPVHVRPFLYLLVNWSGCSIASFLFNPVVDAKLVVERTRVIIPEGGRQKDAYPKRLACLPVEQLMWSTVAPETLESLEPKWRKAFP